jgi:fumarate hydratase class II
MAPTRIEQNGIKPTTLPAHALWGPSTQRAVGNVPISARRLGWPFIRATRLTEPAAAITGKARATGKALRPVALEENGLPAERPNDLPDARRMTEPQG